jgi:hypothetical protein
LIEDVTIGFCALNSLEVIAPHTAIQISNRSKEQPGTLKRFDINYVLDTRLSGADDNDISLFVQLIHADSAEIIWAERYHLEKSQSMRRRRDLSRRIALSVVGRIENDEITRTYIERNAVAYHRYLVGRHYLNRLTLPNLRRAQGIEGCTGRWSRFRTSAGFACPHLLQQMASHCARGRRFVEDCLSLCDAGDRNTERFRRWTS